MRKLILFFSFFAALLNSCREEKDLEPFIDYRCKISAVSQLDTLICFQPARIDLAVDKGNSTINSYEFSYELIEGAGELQINSDPLIPLKDIVSIDIDDVHITYIPKQLGAHNLLLKFENEEYLIESVYSINVKDTPNPELKMYLSGVETININEAMLGETYKFFYNVSKRGNRDDYTYWITLDPALSGAITSNDVTARGGGVDIQTGTIRANENGISIGEVKFTPSNYNYLNSKVSIKVKVRDSRGKEVSQTTTFNIVTSPIEIDLTKRTSIEVEKPYTFFFAVNKLNYNGDFTYKLTGWSEGDKLEVSADNVEWEVYNGGIFDLPDKNHTYIRYTPSSIEFIPLKLFIYDDQEGEEIEEIEFKVIVPKVTIRSNIDSVIVFPNVYSSCFLKVSADRGETVDISFIKPNEFDGVVRWNDKTITATTIRADSGSINHLEVMSKKQGKFDMITCATNRWGYSDSLTTSIEVVGEPIYTLRKVTYGSGTITVSIDGKKTNLTKFKKGAVLTITTSTQSDYGFIRWGGDIMETKATIQITMNSDKSIYAIFEKVYKLNCLIFGEGKIDVAFLNDNGVFEFSSKSSFPENTKLKLLPIPNHNWYFNFWLDLPVNTTPELRMTISKSDLENTVRLFFNQLSTSNYKL